MSALFVGRVGGLAVALGVGAAAFQSAGVAWADPASPDQSASTSSSSSTSAGRHASAAPSASATGGRGSRPAGAAGARAGKSSAAPAAAKSGANPAATKVPTVAVDQPAVAPVRSVATDATPVSAPQAAAQSAVADQAPAPVAPVAVARVTSSAPAVVVATAVAAAPEAAAAAPVSSFLTSAGAAVADSSAGDNTGVPINTPVEWSALAVARRGSVRAAASVAPPAAAQVAAAAPTYSLGACTQASTSCTYIMGPSGVPIPSDTYAQTVMDYYVLPNSTQPQITSQLVYTPEGAYPVTGIKVLPLTISAQQGQTILENTISTLQPGPQAGTMPVNIFGYSQSAVISSLLQRDLTTEIGLLPGLNRDKLTYVTVGQEMNPNGGWFARFPGLNAASLGEYFFGSTPENAFPTTNYSLEYDGFADSPRYPLNFISDLNAAMGILLVHTNYANPKYFAETYGVGFGALDAVMGEFGPGIACKDGSGSTSCTALPTTAADQKYYFIQTPNLPLLAPVRAIPLIGKPLAALIQPVLKVIVNLGYGDPAHGFTSATQPDANVPVPFGLFPQVSYKEVFQQLAAGVKQGVHDFVASFGQGGTFAKEVASIAKSISSPQQAALALPSLNQLLTTTENVITNIGTRISAGASALYASLLASADFINAIVVTLPTYNASLMIDAVKQMLSGQFIEGVVNFLGRPIAADVGMISTISVLQLAVTLEAFYAAATGCGPAAATTGLCKSAG